MFFYSNMSKSFIDTLQWFIYLFNTIKHAILWLINSNFMIKRVVIIDAKYFAFKSYFTRSMFGNIIAKFKHTYLNTQFSVIRYCLNSSYNTLLLNNLRIIRNKIFTNIFSLWKLIISRKYDFIFTHSRQRLRLSKHYKKIHTFDN